jgi:hypothetical protein
MLYGLIDRQLSLVPQLADFTIISMLRMIAKVGPLYTEAYIHSWIEICHGLMFEDWPVKAILMIC